MKTDHAAYGDAESLVNLHHLRVFCDVAASGGVRRSAESLFRASSAITRAIGRLEESLDIQLFERKGTGMLLTAAGETVRMRALRIEDELNTIRAEARALHPSFGRVAATTSSLFQTRKLIMAVMLADIHHMPTVAHLLGVTQPAVSAAIASLEAGLGRRLFERAPHGMVPTAPGAPWLRRFKRVLAELRHIRADIAALRGNLEGIITVGALPLVRTLLLPRAIANVLARHPRVRIRTLESPYEDLCADLLCADVDFILGAMRPLQDATLQTRVLFEENLVLIARAGHPLSRKRQIGFTDLLRYPWVVSREWSPLRKQLNAFFTSHGHPLPIPSVETADLALLRGLLLDTDMLTVLSEHQLHHEFSTGKLVALNSPMDGLTRQIGVTTRTGAQLSPGALALLREVEILAAPIAALPLDQSPDPAQLWGDPINKLDRPARTKATTGHLRS